jgi:putative ABC transport system ATP-binding protein
MPDITQFNGSQNGNAPVNAEPLLRIEPLIRIEDITRTYQMGQNIVRALRGVSVQIQRGDFVAIMGPSGSGKSTFMNVLGCLDRPSSGHYYLDGVSVEGLERDQLASIRNQRIGFVFQQFNLLARTTALENVQLPMLYAEPEVKNRRERAMLALNAVGLAQLAEHKPNEMSGGQQQRVAIARSLVNHPDIILADEPTGALDSKTSIEIMAIFQRLNREEGISIVLVTHEPDISQYARRIIRFKDGMIVADEPVPHPRDADTELMHWELDQPPAPSAESGNVPEEVHS